MNQLELVNHYDERGRILGAIERGRAESQNLILGAVVVFMFNFRGEVWLQLRPGDKSFPYMLDATACGAVQHGEKMRDAAGRELLEETTIDLIQEGLELAESKPFLHEYPNGRRMSHRWKQIFAVVSDVVPELTEETAGVLRIDPEVVHRRARQPEQWFIPSFSHELSIAQSLIN